MYIDLIKRYKLVGLTKTDIIDLLGEPRDFETNAYIYDDKNGNTVTIYFKDDVVINYSYVE